MALFVTGALLEHRLSDSQQESAESGLLRTLAIGALLSIGLGFFTGGLQHFPDSPNRPAWPNTILKPGEQYFHKTVHKFSAE